MGKRRTKINGESALFGGQLAYANQSIPLAPACVTLDLVGSGVHRAELASGGGRQWVVKRLTAKHLQAEALGWLACDYLGVLQPHSAVDAGRTTWHSEFVTECIQWQPGIVPVNVKDIGAMLCVDAVLSNDDRHAGNLLVQSLPGGTFRAVVIDWDAAQVVSTVLSSTTGTAGISGSACKALRLPIDLASEHAMQAAQQLSEVAHEAAGKWSELACWASGNRDDHERLVKILAIRLSAARLLTENYIKALGCK